MLIYAYIYTFIVFIRKTPKPREGSSIKLEMVGIGEGVGNI